MIFVGVYGLILLTEDEKIKDKANIIARSLLDSGFQSILNNISTELNFVDVNDDPEIINKKKYCITAIKRVL